MIDWFASGAPPLPSLRPLQSPVAKSAHMGMAARNSLPLTAQPQTAFVGDPGRDPDSDPFEPHAAPAFRQLSRHEQLDRMMNRLSFIDGTRGVHDLGAIGTDRPVLNATGPRLAGSIAKGLLNLAFPGVGEAGAAIARGSAENALARDLADFQDLNPAPVLGTGHPYDGIDFNDDLFGAPATAPVDQTFAAGEHLDLGDDPFAADLQVDELGRIPGDPGYGY